MSWSYHSRGALRHGVGGHCPVCFGPTSERATYCTSACRQRAHRLSQRMGADPARLHRELATLATELRSLVERYADVLDRPGLRPVLTLMAKASAIVVARVPEALMGKVEAESRSQSAKVLGVLGGMDGLDP